MCVWAKASLLLTLVGCTSVGDFGRPRDSYFVDTVSVNYEKLSQWASSETSNFVLSREEQDIRKAAYHFHQPLPAPLVPLRVAYMIEEGRREGLSTYADSHITRGYADGNARAGEIDEMMSADLVWIETLRQAGQRVRAMDRERLFLLEDPSAPFSDDDRISTHARIAENGDVLRACLNDLDKRLASYHYAVQRTKLEWPGTNLRQTKASLALLRVKVGQLRVDFGFEGSGIVYEEVEEVIPVGDSAVETDTSGSSRRSSGGRRSYK